MSPSPAQIEVICISAKPGDIDTWYELYELGFEWVSGGAKMFNGCSCGARDYFLHTQTLNQKLSRQVNTLNNLST